MLYGHAVLLVRYACCGAVVLVRCCGSCYVCRRAVLSCGVVSTVLLYGAAVLSLSFSLALAPHSHTLAPPTHPPPHSQCVHVSQKAVLMADHSRELVLAVLFLVYVQASLCAEQFATGQLFFLPLTKIWGLLLTKLRALPFAVLGANTPVGTALGSVGVHAWLC